MSKATKYPQGRHPNSLANLDKTDGRPKQYKSKKERRNISVTPECWEGIGKLAEQYGCSNKSEFIEKIGRGIIKLELPA